MKHLLTVILLLNTLIVGAQTLNLKKNKERILFQINKNVHIKRYLSESTQNDTSSNLYDSDSTIDSFNIDNKNATEPEEPISKAYSFNGIGGFKHEPQKKGKENVITWNTYFRYTGGNPASFIIYYIFIWSFFRNLEEAGSNYIEKEVNCTLASQSDVFLRYDCGLSLDEIKEKKITFEQIEKIEIKPDFFFEGKTKVNVVEEMTSTSTALENIKDISIVLDDPMEKLTKPGFKTYSMKSGKLSFEKRFSKFYINNINLINAKYYEENLRILQSEDTITGNYNFTFNNERKDGNYIVNVSCSITRNEDGKTYDLECEPPIPFISNIKGESGIGIDENNNKTSVTLDLGDQEEYYVILTNTTERTTFYRKNSSGLSGGTIAGIVIVSILTLVVISLLVVLLRKNMNKNLNMQIDTTASAFEMNKLPQDMI